MMKLRQRRFYFPMGMVLMFLVHQNVDFNKGNQMLKNNSFDTCSTHVCLLALLLLGLLHNISVIKRVCGNTLEIRSVFSSEFFCILNTCECNEYFTKNLLKFIPCFDGFLHNMITDCMLTFNYIMKGIFILPHL